MRTVVQVGQDYDDRRNAILNDIAEGRVSASMSNIEFFSKPWNELDLDNKDDLFTISTMLTWDKDRNAHVRHPLIAKSDAELALQDKLNKLYSTEPSDERKTKIDVIRNRLKKLAIARINRYL